MSILVMDVTEGSAVMEKDFEVGQLYAYTFSPTTSQKGLLVFVETIAPYGGIMTVRDEKGQVPELAFKAVADEVISPTQFGEVELNHFLVKEGYYVVNIITPTGVEALLGENKNTTADPLIVVSTIEKISLLGVFSATEVFIKPVLKIQHSELSATDILSPMVQECMGLLEIVN